MIDNQTPWTKPQLIALSKGTPEEAVLTHCKAIGATNAILPETNVQLGCDGGELEGVCGNCQSRNLKS